MKSCPFCGGKKIMAEGKTEIIAMVCQQCLARGPELHSPYLEPKYAIASWNKRMNIELYKQKLADARRTICEYDRTLEQTRSQLKNLQSAITLLNELLVTKVDIKMAEGSGSLSKASRRSSSKESST